MKFHIYISSDIREEIDIQRENTEQRDRLMFKRYQAYFAYLF